MFFVGLIRLYWQMRRHGSWSPVRGRVRTPSPIWIQIGHALVSSAQNNAVRFQKVNIDAFAHALPDRVVTSESLEERLAPLYEKLRLRSGRFELMTGIRERRHWEPGTRPSTVAAQAGELALAKAGLPRDQIGCLIHASVCRDFMEPATASVVHRRLELRDDCEVFDLSNACLGVANAMVLAAEKIELGRVDHALVVAGEDGGPLVEQTIESLLAMENAGKAELKTAFASLTIGSGAAAVVLSRVNENQPSSHRLLGGIVRSATQHNELCQGDRAGNNTGPLMHTDAEALMLAGNELARETWAKFRDEFDFETTPIDRYVTHQVGVRHRQLLLETLGMDPERDFPTVETLGNIGSVSLPLGFSMAEEAGFIQSGQRVAMFGIGSGLHCLMLAIDW
ncbi:MAG: 3-oxoacyl-[acyl-carrier-protein] synthase III [Planctomycetota bacterium]|jgi:3-oxoacyl-[acyl-carrier-protein] synthase III